MNVMEYYEELHNCKCCKKLKALEIIKEKEIDVPLFKECPNYDEYMEWCSEKAKLTLQEYDLLKEVL